MMRQVLIYNASWSTFGGGEKYMCTLADTLSQVDRYDVTLLIDRPSITREELQKRFRLDTQRPEWQALFNPVNNLVYNADGRSVHTVVVDGRVVVDAYRQSFVDEGRLFARVQEIGERLQARTGISLPCSRWPVH